MSKTILLISIALLGYLSIHAQYKEYDWHKPPEPALLPDSLQKEDAVIIEQSIRIEIPEYSLSFNIDSYGDYRSLYKKFLEDYSHNITTYKRIKILTQNGLEAFAFIYLPNYDTNRIELIDARTLKQNGEVKDLNNPDIKKIVVFDSEEFDLYLGQYRFAIPGVEVGDEIELIYKTSDYGIRFEKDVFLQTYLPAINSKYIVDIPEYSHLAYKLYNDFPKPDIKKDSSRIEITFKIENQLSLLNQPNASMYLDLPYFSVSVYPTNRPYVNRDHTPKWSAIYYSYAEILKEDQSYSNKKHCLVGHLKDLQREYGKNEKTKIFNHIYDEIKNNVKITELRESQEGFSVSYYFCNNFIDRYNLYVLYRKIFEFLEIEYYVGLGRENVKGPIDRYYLRSDELSHSFYLFKDDEGNYHYIYPHTEDNRYEIDEMPVSLLGTTAIIMNEINDSIVIKESSIPAGNAAINCRKNNVLIDVSTENNRGDVYIRRSYSGAMSTRYRYNNDSIFLSQSYLSDFGEKYYEKDSLQIFDTMYLEQRISERPFNYRYAIKYHKSEFLNSLGDEIYYLETAELLNHKLIKTSDVKRTLSFVYNYCYSDLMNIFLRFDKPVELVNADDFNFNIDNENGEYNFNIKSLNENTISIESQFVLKNSFVPKDQYIQLVNINEVIEKVMNSTILIKVDQ
ncbi:MAG: DUF3857 domain-containing protein [Bacteroidales bacterium]